MANPSSCEVSPAKVDLWKCGVPWIAFGVAAWLLALCVCPPRVASGDLICFKDPGVNWARGEGLVERLSVANASLEPKFYSNYPPGHAALYGIYVKLFGVGPKADEIFDFLLIAAAAVTFWFYVTPRWGAAAQRWPVRLTALAIVLLLPVGSFWSQRERPDALGFLVMLFGLILLRRKLTPTNLFWATFVGSLTSLISPYIFVMTGLVFVVQLVLREKDPAFSRTRSTGEWTKLAAAVVIGGTIPLASVFLIQWINDPDAISRFTTNASGSNNKQAGLGYFRSLLAGDLAHFFSAFQRYDSLRYKWMLCHLIFVGLLTTAWSACTANRTQRAYLFGRGAAIFGMMLIPLLIFPYQPCYDSLTAAMIVATAAEFTSSPQGRFPWLVSASLAFLGFFALPFTLREFAIAYQAEESLHRVQAVAAQLRPVAGERPMVIAAGASSYFQFKQDGFVVHEMSAIPDETYAAKFDLFAFSFNGLKATQPRRYPEWWKPESMELIHRPLSAPVTNVFGKTIYSYLYDWDVEIYRRKN